MRKLFIICCLSIGIGLSTSCADGTTDSDDVKLITAAEMQSLTIITPLLYYI